MVHTGWLSSSAAHIWEQPLLSMTRVSALNVPHMEHISIVMESTWMVRPQETWIVSHCPCARDMCLSIPVGSFMCQGAETRQDQRALYGFYQFLRCPVCPDHGRVAIVFSGQSPILVRIDETLERRRGSQRAAWDVYRDAIRLSQECCVTTRGCVESQ
jgi:hypothetical protein